MTNQSNSTQDTEAQSLIDLAERCERATNPSMELDIAIEQECVAPTRQPKKWLALKYTNSLDAALTLIPDGLEWRIEQRHNKGMFPAYAALWSPGARDIDHHDNATGKTPALALCAAALKAKAQQ